MLRSELEHRVDDLMGKTTARIGLDSDTVAYRRVGLAECLDRFLVKRRALMQHLVKSKATFDGFCVGRVTALREFGGQDAVSRAEADVQRLCHRAEIGHDAAGHRRRDAERHLESSCAKAEQFPARGGGAKGTQRTRRVPAVMGAVAQ